MLVLTRKKGQQIRVACGEITITIVDIRGGNVRIGIEAARDIPIERAELPRNDDPVLVPE